MGNKIFSLVKRNVILMSGELVRRMIGLLFAKTVV